MSKGSSFSGTAYICSYIITMETSLRSDTHKPIKVGTNYCLQFVLFAYRKNIDERIVIKREKSIKMIDVFFYIMKATGTITDRFSELVCTLTSSILLYLGSH